VQGRKGADADPTGCGSIRYRNIVSLVRELEEQLHARRGSPELEPRKPRREGSNESIATVPIFMAGTNHVALVLAFALRAGISTFDLSRYMGASLTMIDPHYGHLARDGREHAIRLLDELSAGQRPRRTLVDAAWTPKTSGTPRATNFACFRGFAPGGFATDCVWLRENRAGSRSL
jgi:hypothetical protein